MLSAVQNWGPLIGCYGEATGYMQDVMHHCRQPCILSKHQAQKINLRCKFDWKKYFYLCDYYKGRGDRNVKDFGLKVICPDKHVKINGLLQAFFCTSTTCVTEKLHTSVISDWKKTKCMPLVPHPGSNSITAQTVILVMIQQHTPTLSRQRRNEEVGPNACSPRRAKQSLCSTTSTNGPSSFMHSWLQWLPQAFLKVPHIQLVRGWQKGTKPFLKYCILLCTSTPARTCCLLLSDLPFVPLFSLQTGH